MDFVLWKEEVVRDLDTAVSRARAGTAYLDKKLGPGWDRDIDLDELDISSPFRCVLGQLGQKGHLILVGPNRGVDSGFSCGLITDFVALVYQPPAVARSFELLKQAWRLVLGGRRRAAERRTEVRVPQPQPEMRDQAQRRPRRTERELVGAAEG